MKPEDYSQGDAFQAEKRTVFSTRSCLPLCAEGQLARPGDFVSATVGGWSVFAVRDKEGAVRSCAMLPPSEHAGRGHAVRQLRELPLPLPRLDLRPAGRFVARRRRSRRRICGRPISSGVAAVGHVVGHRLLQPRRAGWRRIESARSPAYGGTLATDIACNWKVCVEHLLAEHTPSADFTWTWPLLDGSPRWSR